MKKLLPALALLLDFHAPSARAEEQSILYRVMKTLVLNASQVKLVDELGNPRDEGTGLVSLITLRMLSAGHTSMEGDLFKSTTLDGTDPYCEDEKPSATVKNSLEARCTFTFVSQRFDIRDKQTLVVTAENTPVKEKITVETIRANTPGAKMKLKSNVIKVELMLD